MRKVIIVLFPDVELLDLSGPATVFTAATRLLARQGEGYDVSLAAAEGGTVATVEGIRVAIDRPLHDIAEPIDTLVVPGAGRTPLEHSPTALVDGVRALARRARRVASVCSGTFVLGEARLIDGKRVTTHWAAAALLQQRYPKARVDPDAIFVRDGDLWTSAGVTAGVDLALELVRQDHGALLALEVARWLVVYVKRAGGQRQFSALLDGQTTEREPLRELELWMVEHPAEDLSVDRLAQRTGMSRRNFTRLFRAEFGTTPRAYVEHVRIDAARRRLEGTGLPIKRVARDASFGTAETLHRVFERRLGVTPNEYRQRFRGR
jgi:transcriptional regulator GlxA family with amidase domain